MSLLPFLLVTGLGTAFAILLRSRARLAGFVGVLALVAAVWTAAGIRSGEVLEFGGLGLATTEYLRLFLLLGSIVGVGLAIVGAAAGSRRDAAAVSLAILGSSAIALSVPDARVAVLAATTGGAFGILLTLVPSGGRAGATVGTRVLRATVVAGALAIAATAWIGRDLSALGGQPVVFGLAYLAFAIAVAIRFGAIPFHAWAARLTDAVPEADLPVVTAWAPAAFALVALAWTDASIAPLLLDLGSVRVVVIAIAIASIVLASLAAWIQDDLEHMVGYSIVGDAGVVMLAIAALDPAAWAPARTWILVFVVARSAFAAWAAATRSAFFTGRIADLRGWAFRSPLLGVTFLIVVVASLGFPGLAGFDARVALVVLALDGPLAIVVLLGTLSPIVYYGRLLGIGLSRPDPRAGGAPTWRPVMAPIDVTDVRIWAARMWAANRAFVASTAALGVAIIATAAMAGAFGMVEAAAGSPPSLDAAESFPPE
ncbi:MAG TPA: proton-conducting transporter membrane subunit, partial [Candidatus Saccharimonadales bacterium]|nr:proton-conducting transporter membrane subunit [Candidatus Saccharimonadales bacterium]